MRMHPRLAVFLLAYAYAVSPADPSYTDTTWTSGAGKWTDAARWSHGLPDPLRRAAVRGGSTVVIPPGTYLAGDLEVGTHAGDRARVEVDGGQLILRQDSLFVGEDGDGEGTFVLKRGAMHCVMDVFRRGGDGEHPSRQ